MESSNSAGGDKARINWHTLAYSAAALLASIGLAGWLTSRPSLSVSAGVYPAASRVIFAYRLSRIVDTHWDDDLDARYREISSRASTERIEFLAAVLVDCRMDTHVSESFVELIGPDVQLLHDYLMRFATSPQFLKLSKPKQEGVREWIEELG